MKNLHDTWLMGVDIGSGNLKCLIVGADGRLAASASEELKTDYPRPGWAEQNPSDWYAALCKSTRAVLRRSGLKPGQIQCIGITAATHTPVLLDENDIPLRPAILWTDQRSAEESAWLNRSHGEEILRIAYHSANPTWTLSQLFWLQRHEPEVVAKTVKLMMPKDYLRYCLTGVWATDWADALGTLMLDAASRKWSPELCAAIGWPMTTLPPIRPPADVVGGVGPKASADTGLREGTPLVVGTSDTAAECFGVGAVAEGQGLIKLATAGNICIVGETAHPHPLLFNYPHVVPGRWYTAAATNSCAAVHRWLRDRFFGQEGAGAGAGEKEGFDLMDTMAAQSPLGAEGLLFHPYLLGERTPYWDPRLRGDYLGITMRHTRAHFVRALYEGIAFSLLDCMISLEQSGLIPLEIRIIGGGSRSAVWRRIVCDVMGREVLKPAHDDAAFGAALIAGLGIGVYVNEAAAVDAAVTITGADRPDPGSHARYRELFDIFKEAQKRLVEINHRLHAFQSGTGRAARPAGLPGTRR